MFNLNILGKLQVIGKLKTFNKLFCTSQNSVIGIPLGLKRSLIKVSGEKSHDFLQGLVTNDIRHLNDGVSAIYCMFLNTQGRVLYDSIIYKTLHDNEYLLECDSKATNALCKHLTLYSIRRKLIIEPQNELTVWSLLHSPEIVLHETTPAIIPDPRTKLLGSRLVLAQNQNLQSLLPQTEIKDISVYEKLRNQLGIGEGIEDLPPGKALPLESNCDYLHGVSFHKGCYLGQELTARTHHTGVIRKRLLPLHFLEPCDSPLDSPVYSCLKKSVGKLRSSGVNNYGLGLLRLAEALAEEVLYVDGKFPVKTYKPDWWPVEAPKDNQNRI